MDKALEHLDGMMDANMELYEKILDTPGFAYHFNELVKLAQSAAQQSVQVDGARCVAEAGRYLRHLYKNNVCVRCGTPQLPAAKNSR
jgi:hypothetical protein